MKHRTLVCAIALFAISVISTSYSQSVENLHQFQTAPSPYYPLMLQGDIAWGSTYNSSLASSIFRLDLISGQFESIYAFSNQIKTSGNLFYHSFTGNNYRIYGITENGGKSGKGTIFSIKPDTKAFQTDLDFDKRPFSFPSGVITHDDQYVYGTAELGGIGNGGIWKSREGNSFDTLKHFNSSTGYDCGGLVLSGTTLYGMNAVAGSGGGGTIFKINTDGTGWSVVHSFNASSGGRKPTGTVLIDGTTIYGMTSESSTGFGTIFKIEGGTHSTIKTFNGGSTDGATPLGSLILHEGYLYGVTSSGGANGKGIIFKIKTDGTGYTKLYDFQITGNGEPQTPMYDKFIVYNGKLLGASSQGVGGFGTIYKFSFTQPLTVQIAEVTGFCSGSTSGVLGNNVTVTGGDGNYSYSWTGSNLDINTKNTKNARITAAPSDGSTYVLTVTDGAGNTALAETTIDIGTMSINYSANYIYPLGSTFYLGNYLRLTNGHPPFTIMWTGPNGFSATYYEVTSNPAITGKVREVYYVKVRDSYGCECQGRYLLWPR